MVSLELCFFEYEPWLCGHDFKMGTLSFDTHFNKTQEY